MKKELAISITLLLAFSSFSLVLYNSHSWSFIISSILLAAMSLLFGLFTLVLKAGNSKKSSYLFIIGLMIVFLVFGLLQ
ncbi:MAG: hypothetical protein KGO92_11040 [Bacteroidota bacterium]|nr:hypothetical protein [Bacteroidota bacterium]